jgi:hypothetical protein
MREERKFISRRSIVVGGANSNDSKDSAVVFTYSAPFASFCVILVHASKQARGRIFSPFKQMS